jgi:hypothetical protein
VEIKICDRRCDQIAPAVHYRVMDKGYI